MSTLEQREAAANVVEALTEFQETMPRPNPHDQGWARPGEIDPDADPTTDPAALFHNEHVAVEMVLVATRATAKGER